MIAQLPIQEILDKAVAGERLDASEGLRLLQEADLASLGRAADEVTRPLASRALPDVQHRPKY